MKHFRKLLVLLLLCATSTVFSQQGAKRTITYEGAEYFVNGLNVPWNKFGGDFGNHVMWGSMYDGDWFDNCFKECKAHGINVVRLWIHCDARANPEFDTKGFPVGVDSDFFLDMDDCFRRAQKYQIMIMPCMWSFDMCKENTEAGPYAGSHQDLLNEDAKMNAYITNIWEPIVKRYKDQCNLFAWEVCNEPEWALDRSALPDSSWEYRSDYVVPIVRMQKLTGLMAATVHKYSNKMVTTGAASIRWNSDVASCAGNLWSDAALSKATDNAEGAFLDFYQVHYYDYMVPIGGDLYDDKMPASFWELDKPILIGETPADKEKAKIHTVQEVMDKTYANGYAGVMYWSYNANDGIGAWDDFKMVAKDFEEKHPDVVHPQACPCDLLPQDVLQLKATKLDANKYVVSWKAEDPFVLDFFKVEVSVDGVNFKTAKTVSRIDDKEEDYTLKLKSKEVINYVRIYQKDVYELVRISDAIKI